jgi:hypothetical protein
MSKKLISDDKLYEIALNNKQHLEARRDAINNYYTSLFAAIITAIPFIEKATNIVANKPGDYILGLSLAVLSLIGLILALLWLLNLKYMLFYLDSLDKRILNLESKCGQSLFTDLEMDLKYKKAPERVTRYQIIIPYTFIITFLSIIVYCVIRNFYNFTH